MANNATTVKVTADASGYTAELDKARRSADAFQQSQALAAQRVATAQKAIAEAATSGSNASTKAINNFVSQLARTADQAGKTRAQLLEMKAAQLGVAGSVSGYISQIAAASAHTHEFSMASSAARRELLVLAHEASQGNWKRFAGSMMVLGERTDAMGAIMSATGVGVGLFAVALGAAAYEAYKTATAIGELDKASTVTNGYLGLTNDQLSTMAQQLAGANGGLVDTTETMGALIRTGHASANSLAELTGVVTQFGKDAGMSADRAAEAFVKMLDDPKKGMEELQAQYHTFSSAQIEVIDGYTKTGDTAKATQAFIDAVAESQHRMATQGQQEVGLLTKLWQSFSDAAKQAGDNFDKMGAAATNAQKLAVALQAQAQAQKDLKYAQSGVAGLGAVDIAKRSLDAANAQVAAIQKVAAAQQKASDDNAARAKSGDAKIAVDKYMDSTKYANPQRQHSQEIDTENADFKRATANLDKNSADYQAALKRHYENVAQIDAQYAKKTKTHTSENGINTSLASLNTQNAALEEQRKSALVQAKADYQTGAKDYTEYYQAMHDANAQYLNQEIANAQQRVDIAGAKKEGAAQQEALKVWQSLVAQRLAAEQAYTSALDKYAQKRQADVQKYSAQQFQAVRAQQQGYNDKNNTQFMSPSQKLDYSAQEQLLNAHLQKTEQLYEQYAMDPTSDHNEWLQKQQDADDTYALQLQALQTQLAQEQTVRNSYSDQMHLALVGISGDAKSNAQLAGEAFTSTWQTASNALDTFLTTGKGNFSQFAASILSDLAKIALHAAEMQIFQSIGTMAFSTGGAVGSYATGGSIVGAGTGTSDSIPAMLSNGEYVIKASQAKKYGSLLESINNGGVSHFASGGAVGSIAPTSSSGGSPVSVTVHSNGGGGGLNEQDAKELHAAVQAFVDRRMDQKMRGQGGYAYQQRYNQI